MGLIGCARVLSICRSLHLCFGCGFWGFSPVSLELVFVGCGGANLFPIAVIPDSGSGLPEFGQVRASCSILIMGFKLLALCSSN